MAKKQTKDEPHNVRYAERANRLLTNIRRDLDRLMKLARSRVQYPTPEQGKETEGIVQSWASDFSMEPPETASGSGTLSLIGPEGSTEDDGEASN